MQTANLVILRFANFDNRNEDLNIDEDRTPSVEQSLNFMLKGCSKSEAAFRKMTVEGDQSLQRAKQVVQTYPCKIDISSHIQLHIGRLNHFSLTSERLDMGIYRVQTIE